MPSVDWQLFILPTITGVCTPACLLAASISVEAVTPPLVGLALERSTSSLGCKPAEVKHPLDAAPSASEPSRGSRRRVRASANRLGAQSATDFRRRILVGNFVIGSSRSRPPNEHRFLQQAENGAPILGNHFQPCTAAHHREIDAAET